MGLNDIEFDQSLIDDFFTEFHEAYSNVEELLIRMEEDPANEEFINDLFRSLHSIKSNLFMVGFNVLAEFAHIIETILEAIRDDVLQYDSALSDVILLSMDRVKVEADNHFSGAEPTEELANIEQALLSIAESDKKHYLENIKKAIHLLNPENELSLYDDKTPQKKKGNKQTKTKTESTVDEKPTNLQFFKDLILRLEGSIKYWDGRSERIMDIIKALNHELKSPVNVIQLETAVYMHDIGMAFGNIDLLNKTKSLTDEDFVRLKQHPALGYGILSRIPGFDDAAAIILQHHEKFDGTGYPYRLAGADICVGAKMMAIADTFEAMTQERVQRQHKRPIIRAIIEINNCTGNQFDPALVDIFNNVIRNRTKK